MARILIVGCGCRGRALGAALAEDGHAVRGTTRDPARLPVDGVEGVVADPDRLGTLLAHLDGVSVVCWLLGSADGNAEALHGPRLESLLAKLVDTPVRGFVYEGAGSAPAPLLAEGARLVRAAGETFRMPVAVVERDPREHAAWLGAMRDAVGGCLGNPGSKVEIRPTF